MVDENKEKLQSGNQVRNYMDGNHPNRNTRTGASKLIISKLLTKGNFNASSVVDGNGGPGFPDGKRPEYTGRDVSIPGMISGQIRWESPSPLQPVDFGDRIMASKPDPVLGAPITTPKNG